MRGGASTCGHDVNTKLTLCIAAYAEGMTFAAAVRNPLQTPTKARSVY